MACLHFTPNPPHDIPNSFEEFYSRERIPRENNHKQAPNTRVIINDYAVVLYFNSKKTKQKEAKKKFFFEQFNHQYCLYLPFKKLFSLFRKLICIQGKMLTGQGRDENLSLALKLKIKEKFRKKHEKFYPKSTLTGKHEEKNVEREKARERENLRNVLQS